MIKSGMNTCRTDRRAICIGPTGADRLYATEQIRGCSNRRIHPTKFFWMTEPTPREPTVKIAVPGECMEFQQAENKSDLETIAGRLEAEIERRDASFLPGIAGRLGLSVAIVGALFRHPVAECDRQES